MSEMYIGRQVAGRDIHNYEMTGRGLDADVRRRLDEVVALVEETIRSGTVDAEQAADLDEAVHEVTAAAARPERGVLVRTLKGLKYVAAAAASTAGIAEATESVIHAVTGA